jgi:type IV secretion system protein VirB10
MRKLATKPLPRGANDDVDPREETSAEVIDLASRNAYPLVTQRKGKAGDGLAIVAGVLLVLGLGAVTLWSMNSSRIAEPEGIGGAAEEQIAARGEQPPVILQPDEPIQPQTEPQSQPAIVAAPAGDPAPGAVAQSGVNPFSSPAMVFDASARPSTAAEEVPPVAAGMAAAASAVPTGSGRSASDFASRVGGVGGATARAEPMMNPSTTVTEGTLIPAVLETAIDTNVPGFVRAVVSRDVRSFDGTRVLVPRSSRLIGQYQSGLQAGQKRAYVIWTRLIRPDGASVTLSSPAVGFDGSTGIEGKVNSNFFQRFGSALMLSVVDGLAAVASGGASVVLGGGTSAAAAAVQQDSQIGPTVRVQQGEPIRIFIARDLDFTQVS